MSVGTLKTKNMALDTNLVAWYKFDADNSNDAVASNNGTDTSMAYGSSYAKIGHGALFNGSNSEIAFPSGIYGIFSGTSAFTVNMWLKPSSLALGMLFCTNRANSDNYRYEQTSYLNTDGKINFYRSDGSNLDGISGTTALSVGTYYMVTFVFTGTAIYIYVNATQDATGSSTRTAPTIGAGQLGQERANSTTYNHYNGAMDEVGFWSRALSSDEVTALYNGGTGIEYPFTTTSVKDMIGSGFIPYAR